MLLDRRYLAVLRAVYRYSKQYGAWPSSDDVGKRVKRDKTNAHRRLVRLQADGFVQLHKAGQQSGWSLTPTACATLKVKSPPLRQAPARRVRNDPKKLAWHTRRKRLEQRCATLRLYDGLEVVEA